MKNNISNYIEGILSDLTSISDEIFDNPEVGLEEIKASNLLCDFLEKENFKIERGIANIKTAFRATYENGNGGPTIGLLCEYDALPKLGHACGHHMQGPSIIGAAMAIKNIIKEKPYRLVIYGTPAEESYGGKIMMIKNGCDFKELDVALMMHGSDQTQTDIKSLALNKLKVTFYGKNSHAAIKPELGRSSLDAAILSFQGVEFLREHVREEVRIHYNIADNGGTPANIVPAKTSSIFYLRSYNRNYLNSVVERFNKVMQGAALMTETTVEILTEKEGDNKIPVIRLNDLIMKNAKQVNAPRISPSREKTGSTDFGNVLHRVPGTCLRIAFVPEGTPSHSEEFLKYGKSEEAYNAIKMASEILAYTVFDLISDENLLKEIKEEFLERLQKEMN